MIVVKYTEKTLKGAMEREFPDEASVAAFIDVLLDLGFFVSRRKKGG